MPAALEIEAKTGGVIVPPFDDPHIIAGQGTATLELLDDVRARTGGTLDALLVPVGGGGLVAGACLAKRARRRRGVHRRAGRLRCDGAQPRGRRARRGRAGAHDRRRAQAGEVGALNFAIAQRCVRGCLRVDDREIGRGAGRSAAQRQAAGRALRCRRARRGAVARRGGIPGAPRRVGVILSGGNVGTELVREILERFPPL